VSVSVFLSELDSTHSRRHQSQASAVAHGTVIYIGRLISKGKMRYSTYRPGKTGVIMSVRSTNSPNLAQIGCKMAPPHGGEI